MKEENKTSNEESGRCVICLGPIDRVVESRTIRLAGSEFLAHGFCLLRLRQLACKLYDAPTSTPTLKRALTLNEFLLSKRPRNASEILCCMAFYLHRRGARTAITASLVQQQLRLSAFKITDIPSALQEASEKRGYLSKRAGRGQGAFVLTDKGLQLVNRLPAMPE